MLKRFSWFPFNLLEEGLWHLGPFVDRALYGHDRGNRLARAVRGGLSGRLGVKTYKNRLVNRCLWRIPFL